MNRKVPVNECVYWDDWDEPLNAAIVLIIHEKMS